VCGQKGFLPIITFLANQLELELGRKRELPLELAIFWLAAQLELELVVHDSSVAQSLCKTSVKQN